MPTIKCTLCLQQYQSENVKSKICDECIQRKCYVCKGDLTSYTDMTKLVCFDCRKRRDIYITSTDAKRQYFIPEKNLLQLFHFQIYSMYGLTNLYIENDVKKYCDENYLTWNTLAKLKYIKKLQDIKDQTEAEELKTQECSQRMQYIMDILKKMQIISITLDSPLQVYYLSGNTTYLYNNCVDQHIVKYYKKLK